MADAFTHRDARQLLKNKHILYLGDSNIRAQYKDLVWLLNFNTLITKTSLRGKLEPSYLGDELLSRSQISVHRGRTYMEARRYKDRSNLTTVEFMFIARCYTRELEDLFNSYKRKKEKIPDVVVINSCLWDLTRWGPNGVPEYKDNMVKLMRLLSESLPKTSLVIWTTALPAASHVGGGLIIKQIEFMQPLLRFEVMEANMFAREVVVGHGFDVLDNHFYMRMQIHRLFKDGVHYTACPVRLMTNLLLTHLALSWGDPLPGNITSIALAKTIDLDKKPLKKETPVKLPTTGIFARLSPLVPKSQGLRVTVNTASSSRSCDLSKDNFQEQMAHRRQRALVFDEDVPTEQTQRGHTSRGSNRQVSLQTDPVFPRYWDLHLFPNLQNNNLNIDSVPNNYVMETGSNLGPYRQKKRKNKNKRSNPYWNNQYNRRY